MTTTQPKKPTIDNMPASVIPAGEERSLDSTWIKPDQVFLDFELPYLKIARALDQSDDAAIWDQFRESRNQGTFLDWLATWAEPRPI